MRGLEKKEALRRLLEGQTGESPAAAAVEQLYAVFKAELERVLPRIEAEIAGAGATFRALRAAGVAVAVGSGFPQVPFLTARRHRPFPSVGRTVALPHRKKLQSRGDCRRAAEHRRHNRGCAGLAGRRRTAG